MYIESITEEEDLAISSLAGIVLTNIEKSPYINQMKIMYDVEKSDDPGLSLYKGDKGLQKLRNHMPIIARTYEFKPHPENSFVYTSEIFNEGDKGIIRGLPEFHTYDSQILIIKGVENPLKDLKN